MAISQLFPVKALWCGPADLGSQDCQEGCFCNDGFGYAIKKFKPDKTTPHNEWFCSNLASMVGLLTPEFNAVEHTDGKVWFGSQWVVGEIKDWWLHALAGTIKIDELAVDLSRIYAFDLFVHNVDRHVNNYLVIAGQPSAKLYLMDFARAWLCSGFPPPDLPLHPNSKTVIAHRWLKNKFPLFFDLASAQLILDEIDQIKPSSIATIISRQPSGWLTKRKASAIMKWWGTGEARARTKAIRIGMQNGTLF